MRLSVIKKKLWTPKDRVPEGRHMIANWFREHDQVPSGVPEEYPAGPFIEMQKYGKLLQVLPDHIVESLEKARLERAGVGPMLKAGLGFEELLSSIIVDGTAVGTSAAEARLSPALLIGRNYLAPGGIPGRTLQMQSRGRVTTLGTSATMIYRVRTAITDVITGTIVMQTSGITQDTVVQTNAMWEFNGLIVTRAVGAAGSVFAIGRAEMATQVLTVAGRAAGFAGSAGATAPAAATWDTTVDNYFQFTAQWSLATAYSIQAHQYILEALN